MTESHSEPLEILGKETLDQGRTDVDLSWKLSRVGKEPAVPSPLLFAPWIPHDSADPGCRGLNNHRGFLEHLQKWGERHNLVLELQKCVSDPCATFWEAGRWSCGRLRLDSALVPHLEWVLKLIGKHPSMLLPNTLAAPQHLGGPRSLSHLRALFQRQASSTLLRVQQANRKSFMNYSCFPGASRGEQHQGLSTLSQALLRKSTEPGFSETSAICF